MFLEKIKYIQDKYFLILLDLKKYLINYSLGFFSGKSLFSLGWGTEPLEFGKEIIPLSLGTDTEPLEFGIDTEPLELGVGVEPQLFLRSIV